ncbi:MAG: hypothetical protein VXW58_15725, partial [Pseudomonadota bacterium]|nr:hypothetical protein [Pseudomonadota bacterium]
VTAMMQAYIDAIQPRPKGNIHAAQDLSFTDLRLEWGDTISIEVSCVEKETRKGRHWVQFGIRATRNDDLAMTGAIRSIWAA